MSSYLSMLKPMTHPLAAVFPAALQALVSIPPSVPLLVLPATPKLAFGIIPMLEAALASLATILMPLRPSNAMHALRSTAIPAILLIPLSAPLAPLEPSLTLSPPLVLAQLVTM